MRSSGLEKLKTSWHAWVIHITRFDAVQTVQRFPNRCERAIVPQPENGFRQNDLGRAHCAGSVNSEVFARDSPTSSTKNDKHKHLFKSPASFDPRVGASFCFARCPSSSCSKRKRHGKQTRRTLGVYFATSSFLSIVFLGFLDAK